MLRLYLLCLAIAHAAGSGAAAAQEQSTARVSVDAPPDETGWGTAAGLHYLEIVRGGASPSEALPLLVVVHGLGDKPHHDWLEAIDVDGGVKARMILPQAPTPHGRGYSWFPYRAGSLDQASLASGISAAAQRLTRMITVLKSQRRTRGKAVITGFSQGGMLSYAVALSRPDLIEQAVPISGMLPVPLWPTRPRDARWFPSIHALHGKADTIVRFDLDRQLVDRMRELGYPVELAAFDNTAHTITPAMSARVRSTLSKALAPKKSRAPARTKHPPIEAVR